MKLRISQVVVFLAFFGFFIAAILGGCGCKSLDPQADQLIVRAEQTAKTAFAIMDTFLKYEYENRILIPKEGQELAAWLREQDIKGTPRGLAIVEHLLEVKRAYSFMKEPGDKDELQRAIITVETAVRLAQKYITLPR